MTPVIPTGAAQSAAEWRDLSCWQDMKGPSASLGATEEALSLAGMLRPLLLLFVGGLSAMSLSAHARESCVREAKVGDPIAEITLGCVPRNKEFTLYQRGGKNEAIETTFDIDPFPTGYAARIERQGNYSFFVDSILNHGDRQVLRGSLSDGRGCPIAGKFFVYAKDWACTLYVRGEKQ